MSAMLSMEFTVGGRMWSIPTPAADAELPTDSGAAC